MPWIACASSLERLKIVVDTGLLGHLSKCFLMRRINNDVKIYSRCFGQARADKAAPELLMNKQATRLDR
jgi:hypothetical protein